ncbi:MAG: preprotein translocase subunit YajC [Actinobacteria bacterium]|nr:preprotein translocase subunit YajC [Actinomycetota bacterium]
MEIIPFLLLFALMWLLLIRPQQARVRKQRELVASIQVGDEVLTAGGIVGTVRVLGDQELRLEVSPGVELRLLRGAVSRRLEPEADTAADDPPADGLGPDDER